MLFQKDVHRQQVGQTRYHIHYHVDLSRNMSMPSTCTQQEDISLPFKAGNKFPDI